MKVLRNKSFSAKEEDNKKGKVAAGVAGGTVAAVGASYAGLKLGKKGLEKKLGKQREEYIQRATEVDKFVNENIHGAKNAIKNFISPKRKKAVLATEEKLNEKVGQAAQEVAKTRGKIEKIDRVLDAPKKVIDKIKTAANKPGVKKAGNKVKNAAIVAERKTRGFLRNAAKDVRGLIKK